MAETTTRPRHRVAARLTAGRRGLRLRTKVSLLFGLLALIAGVSVGVISYTFARTSLVDQRETEARRGAIANAVYIANRVDAGESALTTRLASIAEQGGFALLVASDGTSNVAGNASFADPLVFPADLRALVASGASGSQRFETGGKPYIGVGIPLRVDDLSYFEAFPLSSTEDTLRTLLLTFSAGATVAVLVFGAVGIWIGRRVLRPLGRVTTAAEAIAAGDLTTRVTVQRDPDLAPLVDAFNGMADAVQTRIERETRFASDVSHELRSPITALQAATDILERRRDEFNDRSRQAIDVIIAQVRRFDQMVLDLLELARIDAGVGDLHVERVDLIDDSHRIAARYGLGDLPIEAAADAPRHALLDRVRYERVLGNLLSNAKVHAGGPTGVLIAPDREGDAGFVEVAVEDRGPGVDPDEQHLIFDRFARGRESRHRVGTGLGLALVAEHSAALGGEAWVENRDGGGARFVVRLPASGTDETDETDQPDDADATVGTIDAGGAGGSEP